MLNMESLIQNCSPILSEASAQRLEKFFQYLAERNQETNLTRITEPEEVFWKHLMDSLAVVAELPESGRIADTGTGAGFPGMVLACLDPEREIHLLDAVRKKCDFLESAAATLELFNVHVHHLRVEEAGAGPLREQFAMVVSRAFADPFVCLEMQLPLVQPGGFALLMEGPAFDNPPEFSAAAQLLGGNTIQIRDYTLDRFGLRRLVRVEKPEPTPPRFPRRPAAMKNKPLWKLLENKGLGTRG